MQIESKFYDRLHRSDAGYGRNIYDVPRLMRLAAFQRWSDRNEKTKAQLRVLDIGCGKGQFLFDVIEALRRNHQADFKRIAVVDLIRAEGSRLGEISPAPEFFQQSVDGQKLPFEGGSFDLVSCNHVLEHIFETEQFVCEIRRVLQPGGLAVISVPNCAAWMNPIAFLFGGQPLGSEVGTNPSPTVSGRAFCRTVSNNLIPLGTSVISRRVPCAILPQPVASNTQAGGHKTEACFRP